MKKYKECPPEDTIAKIKSILASNNLKVKITKTNNGVFYSCRVDICNSRLKKLGFGTNGKGMSESYSLASGYAELMERIQNKLLFRNGSLCFEAHLDNALKRAKIIENHYDKNECLFYNTPKIDFYSVREKCIKSFSINDFLYTTGSNGMCAGNTAKEAITQGVCEIFERYAISQIFHKKLSLPTIPLNYYKGTILYKKINGFIKRNNNINVIIKDCSLGIGLPVVGVLIIDTVNQVYNFNLGSDCNPIVATERCFTELFQNIGSITEIPFQFSCEPTIWDLDKIVGYGGGQWPFSIFNDTADFVFDPNSQFYSNRIENDLQYCTKIINNFGHDIYIRDNSYLGFPTYYVVIPGMSMKKNSKLITDKYLSQSDLYSKLDKLSNDELWNLISELENDYSKFKGLNGVFDITKYFPINSNNDLQNLDFDLFLSMSMYKLKMYNKFIMYMDNFLNNKDWAEYIYFYAAYNFVLLYQVKKIDLESVTNILTKCYGEELTKEVICDMINPDEIFKYYKFPSYPDCSKCKLKKDCRVDDVVQICLDLRKKEISANIDQKKLADIFDFEN